VIRTFAAALFALLAVIVPARATTIQWDFSDIAPYQSVAPITVTGFFNFNTGPCCLPSEYPNYDLTLTDNGNTIYQFIPSNSFFETIDTGGFVLENNGASITNLDSILLTNVAGFDGTIGPTLNLSHTNLDALFTSSKFGFVNLQLQGQLVEAPVSTVPLPAALPLFGTALAGLGGVGWTKKRRRVSR